MAIFRKKQQQRTAHGDRKETRIYEDDSYTSTFPKVKGKDRRSMGKWVCGSAASKQTIEKDNKISMPPKASSSYSSSTSSSFEDKRDDRQNSFNRKSSARERHHYTDNDRTDNSLITSIPPPAAQAAFNGPPLFDWIDVEYHAATRVQKMFRRHLVLQEMEHAGMTTSYIRNRKRERNFKASYFSSPVSKQAPDLGFGCCSMGLAFGNGDLEISDSIAYHDFQRKQYEEKNNSRKEREEFLSQSYLEQKGIHSKFEELEQTKFRDQSMLRERSLRSL